MALANVIAPPDEVVDTGNIYLDTLTWSQSSAQGLSTYYVTVQTFDRPVKSVELKGWGSLGDIVIPYIGGGGNTVGLMTKSTNWFIGTSWVGLRITL